LVVKDLDRVLRPKINFFGQVLSRLINIVIVHGLQGHPKKTWTKSKVKRTRWPHGLKASSEDYYADVYCIPNNRILVYGYDSKVPRFFKGFANQNSLVAHEKNLLNNLMRIREQSVREEHSLCHVLLTLSSLRDCLYLSVTALEASL